MVPDAAELELDSRSRGDVVVVTARGVLDVSTSAQLRDYLAKVGADQPAAVVVDLAGLDIRAAAATAMLVGAHEELARWPGVPMVLMCADEQAAEVLARQRLSRFVSVERNEADAIAAAGEPPVRLVDRLLLSNSPGSVGIARRFVQDSCVLWGQPELADDAAALLGELVANAVVHTESLARVRVELRRGLLSVAG
jgi:anti-anti-sigma factor